MAGELLVNSQHLKKIEPFPRSATLAWEGKHAQAIELATQALSLPNIKPAEQMDLLDLRAESYAALLNLDAAEKDAVSMARIAKKEKKAGLQSQALIRKAFLQMDQGKHDLAAKTFSTALKLARQDKHRYLEAQSLFGLGLNQTVEPSIKSLQQAADLFLSLGNQTRMSYALGALSVAFMNAGRMEDAQRTAQTALTICEEAGDNWGKGWALSFIADMQTDLSRVLKLQKQAYQAEELAGDLRAINAINNNLGYAYLRLGLYPRALRSYQKCFDLNPYEFVHLSNIADAEIRLNSLVEARKYIAQIHSMPRDERGDAITKEISGRLALIEGKPKTALQHFKSAIKISHEAGLAREIGELALLGEAHLARRNFTAALIATTRAVKMHRDLDFPFIDDHPSQNIWWWHAQALKANKNPKEASKALETAYDFLVKGIANTSDEGLRRNHLNKIEVNREIVQAWVKENARRKLPKERLFAHLTSESSLREPFQRLAEISLELNQLKTVAEIQTFLVEEATELSGGERVMLILEKGGKLEVAESLLPRGEDAGKVLASIKKHLNQVRRSRTVQLIGGKGSGEKDKAPRPLSPALCRIVAPLLAQNHLLGYLYVDMSTLYGAFDETDRDMLGMLANQAAVALDNAGLLEELEVKVQERTEQLNARVDELAILNSVGEAMAKTMDVKTVTKIVGDKVQNIFSAEIRNDTFIRSGHQSHPTCL